MADSEQPPDPSEAAPTDSVGKEISPAETASSPSPPPSKCCSIPQRRLLAALTATDVTVQRLNKLISTASGQETILGTIEYIAQTIHHLLASAPWLALQARLTQLRPGRKSSSNPESQKTSSSPTKPPLLALSSLISETRYNIRLFGLIPLWMWGSNTLKSPPADPVVRTLTLLQVLVNVIYQALENVAYLASKGIVSKRFVNRYGGIDKWYLWSTRMWFGHIFFQFIKLWRQHVLRKRKENELASQENESGDDVEEDEKRIEQEALSRKQEIRAWKKSFVSNLLWAPLCVHWSLEKGIGIPSSTTGFVSFLAGAWDLRDSWNATAPS